MIVKNGLFQIWRVFWVNGLFLIDSLSSRLFLDTRQMFFETWKQIVKIGKNTYYSWKVSAWLSKLDSTNLEGFLGKRYFFGWLTFFKTFSWHSADVFWTLKADCQNCVFICPDKLLLEKIYSWKNVQFDVFFQEGGQGGLVFFRVLWKNWNFGGKLSGESSERDSTFPELLFEVRHVFPKNFL